MTWQQHLQGILAFVSHWILM